MLSWFRSRQIAESSPYFEAMKEKDVEVLFCYEPYDELVLMNLGQFQKKNLKSIENEMLDDSKSDKGRVDSSNTNSLTQEQADDLTTWLQITLGSKIQKAKVRMLLFSVLSLRFIMLANGDLCLHCSCSMQ